METTWTQLPDHVDAASLTAMGDEVILGGEGRWFLVDLTDETPRFEELPLPKRAGELEHVGRDDFTFSFPTIDRSTTPHQWAVNLMEYQGGSWGMVILAGGEGEYISSPLDADIPWAHHYALRGDELIAWGGYELFHYRRDDDGRWTSELIAFPSSDDYFEVCSLALSHDATRLLVSTDGETTMTAVFSREDGRFTFSETLPGIYYDLRLYEDRSVAFSHGDRSLVVWDAALPDPASARQIELPRGWCEMSGNADYTIRTTGSDVSLYGHEPCELLATFALPEPTGSRTATLGSLAGNRVVVVAQNQLGVFELDLDLRLSTPRAFGAADAPIGGYEGALEIFDRFADYPVDRNAGQIVSLLEALPSGRQKAGEWLWRGLRDGAVQPSLAFARALAKDPEVYEPSDAVAYLNSIDQHDRNAWASTAPLVKSKLDGEERRFLKLWERSEGVLRAELGTFLATKGLLRAEDLPDDSLTIQAERLARMPLSRHPDMTYPYGLERTQKIWSDRAIARAMLTYLADADRIGRELQQWFELVWPHATPAERVELIIRTSPPENVVFFADHFERHGLDTATRTALEDRLAQLLTLELGLNPFLSGRLWGYTFLTAAVALGIDAGRRSVGMSATGGAAFARALELSDSHPQSCGLTPELEALLSRVFGMSHTQ